jgi:hypothetical protein
MVRRIDIAGTPAELGRGHGRSLGQEIRELRRALLRYLAQVSLYAGALPLFALLAFLARRFWPHIPPRLQEEMRGVAAGAEVGLGTILLLNVLDDLGNLGPRCSALAAGAGRAAGGAWLMGRNLDYPLFVEIMVRLQYLFVMEPHQGLPLASLAWPGYVGVCTGMNKAGVALAQLTAMSRDRTRKGTPAALRFRQALETGTTLDGVAAALLKASGTIGNNVMLCSPRAAAVVELSARQGAVRRPREGLLTVTNHYQSPDLKDLKGNFPPRPPFSTLTPYHFTEAYSRSRETRLQELAARRRLTVRDLQMILADPRVANPGTALSAVFAPAALTLWVAQGAQAPVSQGPFARVKPWG